MGVPSYMLSVLHRQALLLKDGFARRYPSDWLVWEPGPWKPARTEFESNLTSTVLPSDQTPTPASHDPLCFALQAPPSGVLKLGRATQNDIVINDLTAPREQLSLVNRRGTWFLLAPKGAVVHAGAPVTDLILESRVTFRVGDVTLTFLSSVEMAARAKDFAKP